VYEAGLGKVKYTPLHPVQYSRTNRINVVNPDLDPYGSHHFGGYGFGSASRAYTTDPDPYPFQPDVKLNYTFLRKISILYCPKY
jgi:hypothetical protein